MAPPKPASRAGRVILLSSPKGGTGKSSIARNLLVAAARERLSVLGIDFDQQGTLAKWAERRGRLRQVEPGLAQVEVRPARISTWRQAMATAADFDVTIVDTAPSIEAQYNAAIALAGAAHVVLVPVGQTQDDIDSASPWMEMLRKAGVRASFVINRANRRTRSYDKARASLLGFGPLAPVEIPLLEDIHVTGG
jgi:chromosome partitioning protein